MLAYVNSPKCGLPQVQGYCCYVKLNRTSIDTFQVLLSPEELQYMLRYDVTGNWWKLASTNF